MKDFFNIIFWQQLTSEIIAAAVILLFANRKLNKLFGNPQLELVFDNGEHEVLVKRFDNESNYDCTINLKIRSNSYLSRSSTYLSFEVPGQFNRPTGPNHPYRVDRSNNSVHYDNIEITTDLYEGLNSIASIPELKLRLHQPEQEYNYLPWEIRRDGLVFKGQLSVKVDFGS